MSPFGGSFGGGPGLPGLPGAINPQPTTGGGKFDPPFSDFGASSAVIVNRTLFYADSAGISPSSIAIPATTQGNTLVVVQMSNWWPSNPVFNGVCAGFPITSLFGDPNNNQVNGFSGWNLDLPGDNSGAEVGYFTNIAGGITEISYPADFHGKNCGPPPTAGIVYEIVPSLVTGISSTADIADSFLTSPPTLTATSVSGPASGGFYISTIVYYDTPMGASIGNFSAVSSPWALDYQGTYYAGAGISIGFATAIILSGSGTQQAIFTWNGSSGLGFIPIYGATSISLFVAGTTSGGTIWQPNVCIVC